MSSTGNTSVAQHPHLRPALAAVALLLVFLSLGVHVFDDHRLFRVCQVAASNWLVHGSYLVTVLCSALIGAGLMRLRHKYSHRLFPYIAAEVVLIVVISGLVYANSGADLWTGPTSAATLQFTLLGSYFRSARFVLAVVIGLSIGSLGTSVLSAKSPAKQSDPSD